MTVERTSGQKRKTVKTASEGSRKSAAVSSSEAV